MQLRMTLSKKLLISVGTLLALTLALGISSLNSISNLADRLDTTTQKTAKRLKLAGHLSQSGTQMLAGERGLAMHGFVKSLEGVEKAKALIQSAADDWQRTLAPTARPLVEVKAIPRTVRESR